MDAISGCDTLTKLWQEAIADCRIHQPGFIGSSDRAINYVKCDNIQWSMTIAMMQCWNERGNKELCPVFINKDENIHTTHTIKQSKSNI
jgi:hypothetical protein